MNVLGIQDLTALICDNLDVKSYIRLSRVNKALFSDLHISFRPEQRKLSTLLRTRKPEEFKCFLNIFVDIDVDIDWELFEFCVELHFGLNFNQCVDYLPSRLEKLEFIDRGKFNQSIDYLPKNLKVLILNSNFNKNIDWLPENLKELRIGDRFNKKINHLPPNLVTLIFTENSIFNSKLVNIPSSLKNIKLGRNYNRDINLKVQSPLNILLFHSYSCRINKMKIYITGDEYIVTIFP